MNINVGTVDRVLRVLAGLVLIALAATGTVGWWGWLGVVPLATGLFRFCPAYTLLGINTCPMKNKTADRRRHAQSPVPSRPQQGTIP